MFQLSALFKELIRSDPDPMDVDPYVPIPIKHLQFLDQINILLSSTQSHTIDRVEFQAAIASQWRLLWPWLKTSLAAILVYERGIEIPADVCHRIALCSHPVLSLIALIMETISPSTATFTTRVFEAPQFNKLVAVSWITSIRRSRNSDYARLTLRMMIAMWDDRINYDEALDVFGDELKTSFTRITGATPARFCKGCLMDEFLGIDKDVQRKHDTEKHCSKVEEKSSTSQPCSIDGVRLYMLLYVFPFPSSGAFSKLDDASSYLRCICQVWRLIISNKVVLTGTAESNSHNILVACLEVIMYYLKIIVSGGPFWVSLALDHRVLTRIAQTCSFLYASSSSSMDNLQSDVDHAYLRFFRDIVLLIHAQKCFHSVDYRIEHNLQHGIRCSDPLPLPDCVHGSDLQSSWALLVRDLCSTNHVQWRKALWKEALAGYCDNRACQTTSRNFETRRLLCTRCLIAVYCSAQCQRSHFANHRLICKTWARNKLQHVTFGAVPYGFAYPLSQPERLYISCMLIEIVSGLDGDMITLIKERDLVSQPSAIVVDLVNPSYPISLKFTWELTAEMCSYLQRQVEEQRPRLICCGRVPSNVTHPVLLQIVIPPILSMKLFGSAD
ncbi:hypothetical protein F5879DRAFT_995841 [Lentinula edodes]|nr:hypothetical protein F5879DRAFT_995841 [Lentinula edodes]